MLEKKFYSRLTFKEFLSSDVKTAKILTFEDLINNLGHKPNDILHDLSKGIDGNEFGGRNALEPQRNQKTELDVPDSVKPGQLLLYTDFLDNLGGSTRDILVDLQKSDYIDDSMGEKNQQMF